jgi:hypothetical protein
MAEEKIIYNGVSMIKSWPAKIEAAQKITVVRIGGVEYPRIRYGKEEDDWGADRHPCHDCGVLKRSVPRA